MVGAEDGGGGVRAVEEGSAAGELGRFLALAEEAGGDFGLAVLAVLPGEVDGGAVFSAGGEVHGELGDDGEDGGVVIVHAEGFDFGGEAHVEFVVEVVENVGSPVAEHAHAVFVKAAPVEGVVEGVEGELFAGAAPEVPVFEGGGDGVLG